MFRAEIKGIEKIIRETAKMPKAFREGVQKVLVIENKLFVSHIRKTHFGKTSSRSLQSRTGKLAGSIKSLNVKVGSKEWSLGVSFGTKYARVHVGEKGQETTIKAKKAGGFLTIPLPAAKTAAGVLRGSALSGIWGDTFIAKGVIFQDKGAGKIIPLFVLKKMVKIKARIHPSEIFGWFIPEITKNLDKMLPKKFKEIK